MSLKSVGMFLARLRQWYFEWRISREIFERLFPHLNGEKHMGYPFNDSEQMNAQTETQDASVLLERIERQILQMPEGYGECFRHVMHRDLNQRLRLYECEARRRREPTQIDPRFVATLA